MIKERSLFLSNLTGVLITEGPGFFRSTGKALACFKINRKIGFLKSSSYAIKLNFLGEAARAKYKGSNQVRCGPTKM